MSVWRWKDCVSYLSQSASRVEDILFAPCKIVHTKLLGYSSFWFLTWFPCSLMVPKFLFYQLNFQLLLHVKYDDTGPSWSLKAFYLLMTVSFLTGRIPVYFAWIRLRRLATFQRQKCGKSQVFCSEHSLQQIARALRIVAKRGYFMDLGRYKRFFVC